MKTLVNYPPTNDPHVLNGSFGFRQSTHFSPGTPYYQYDLGETNSAISSLKTNTRSYRLLTDEAIAEITRGGIPNLERVCRDLYRTFLQQQTSYTALQFIPVLKKLTSINHVEAKRFLRNPTTNHVLVQNALLKVVLIHWKPGKTSSIHGHPKGGCVFKVLQGCLEEKRYSPDKSQQRLIAVSNYQSGSMAYIDDDMAYHAVSNPFNTSAISLHVYTPGGKRK